MRAVARDSALWPAVRLLDARSFGVILRWFAACSATC